MKTLLVHISNSGRGGGVTAMNRLHRGLIKAGVDSKILCLGGGVDTADSVTVLRTRLLAKIESQLRQVTSRLGLNDVHCLSSFGIRKMEAYVNADIIDFHCIHSGYFNYFALPSLTKSKAAVFTLHDMWPFTGHCHNSRDCERWKTGCGKCPYPETAPAIRRDATRLEWRLKDWAYKHANLTLVVPSTWLASQVKQSMLREFPVHHIPHGIDTAVYQPLDPERCRSVLGVPAGKKVLLFVVDDLRRYLKGGDLLVKALQELPAGLRAEIVLLTLGVGGEMLASAVDIPTIQLGYTDSDRLKAICYSAADLCVLPTRAESFGLVLLESMACGTPMVSFRVGGVPDLVRPDITGALAEPENARDLSVRIVQLLEDQQWREHMKQQCRAIALTEYSIELQTRRYIELYHHLLRN